MYIYTDTQTVYTHIYMYKQFVSDINHKQLSDFLQFCVFFAYVVSLSICVFYVII